MQATFPSIIAARFPALAAAASSLSNQPLFPFQEQVLLQSGLLQGESLLCAAPPGAGKSLLGDAALLRTLARHQTAVYLASTRALARERARQLQDALGPDGYRVAASTRDDREADEEILAGRVDVIVTVYEKARILFLRSPAMRGAIGLVVADEFHLLDDPERGPAARLLVQAWLRGATPPQLVALTSAIEQAPALAEPFGLSVASSTERPVSLRLGNADLESGVVRWACPESGDAGEIQFPAEPSDDLACRLVPLIQELEKPVLLFAATRRQARELASMFASHTPAEFEPDAEGLLSGLLPRRVGLHSTELTRRQRRLVEESLQSGEIDICVATTTLAEGINAGVRSVVILPGVERYAGHILGNLLGRAGRPGSGPGYGLLIGSGHAESAKHDKPHALSDARRVEQLIEAIAFLLEVESDHGEERLASLLDGIGAPPDLIAKALAGGARLGFWRVREGVLEPTMCSRFIAGGGLSAVTVAGWRTLLRRFPGSGEEAAAAFLALGGSPCVRSLALDPDERQSARWPAVIVEEMAADGSPLARYFMEFLRGNGNLPRSLHQAAKGAALFLEARRGMRLNRLAAEFRMAPGLVEEFLHTASYMLWSLAEFARGAGANAVAAPAAAPIHDEPAGQAELPRARIIPHRPRLVIHRGSTGLVEVDGKPIYLTRLQFRMLDLLARNVGRGVPYERVEDYVWPDAKVERQQISFHRKNLELRLHEASPQTTPFIETMASWGLRLLLDKDEISFEETAEPQCLLESPALIVPINFIAGEVCV